jgi:hypothetical protein
MAYDKKIGTDNPGVIVLLIDQSASMSDAASDGKPKADHAALAVNRVIYEIQEASQAGSTIKPRCMVGIVGYGAQVGAVASGMIDQLAANPRRVEKLKRKVDDGAGGLVEVDFNMPIWVDPAADNGTPMAEAFAEAIRVISNGWIPSHPDSFPPIVINITDGEPNDATTAAAEARRLMGLQTSDGNVLLFNVHISSNRHTGETALPSSSAGLADNYARFLFDISSPLPDALLAEAEKVGFAPDPGARGFIFNATPESLIKLLTFGSSGLR